MKQVVDLGGDQVDEEQTSDAEDQQAFQAYPALEVKEHVAVIPPSLPVMHRFQKDRSKIFHTSADSQDTDKFQDLILSILVYTFFTRMFDFMLPLVVKHSIVAA